MKDPTPFWDMVSTRVDRGFQYRSGLTRPIDICFTALTVIVAVVVRGA
jgi:hypothetical protein